MLALLGLGAVIAGWALTAPADDAAARRPTAEQVAPQTGGYADPVDQWLEEVRAQRRAWEERRRATKEAINARRRLTDPWGAAHQEAHEKENQRRRDAMMDQIERDRETFREQGPWQATGPKDLGPPPPAAPPISAGAPPEPGGTDGPVEPPAYPPSGWNNRWYYRGY
jgi:hypothetical protein